MKSSFASSLFFEELKHVWWRGFFKKTLNLKSYHEAFSRSGYESALLTLSMLSQNEQQHFFKPHEIVLYLRDDEVETNIEKLKACKKQGVRIIISGSHASKLRKASLHRIFEEVHLWITEVPVPEDLEVLSRTPFLRIVIPYNVPTRKAQKIISRLEEKGIRVKSSAYLDLPAQETKVDFWFDPQIKILQKASETVVYSSVIIPFQDNTSELLTTLKFLKDSLPNSSAAEAVIVDDSFSQDESSQVLPFVNQLGLPCTYIKLQRPLERNRGDFQFRAGVARNIGAAYSRGEELVFLDSDILLGPNFWTELEKARFWTNGPLMPKRYYLKEGISWHETQYKDLKKGEHTYLSWGGHWEDLYSKSESEPEIWRWVSTFCLALPKRAFDEVGGFRRSFYCYGFEDTELGYRLSKNGYQLRIFDSNVFHLPVTKERSEFSADPEKKKKLLSNSFRVFLRHALNSKIFPLFDHMMEDRRG